MSQSDTRSLQQIKEETEQTRADLAVTVAQLRSSIVETSQDLRERIRPAALKAEVRTYVRSRGEQLFDDMNEAIRKNPLQAAAVFGSIAYPLFRLARAIPIPIYMIGAGLYLAKSETGKAATQKVSDAAADMIDQASQRATALRERVGDAAAAVGVAAGGVRDRVSDAAAAVGDTAGGLRERVNNAAAAVGNTAGGLRDRVSNAAAAVGNTAGGLKDTMAAGAQSAASGSEQLRNAAGAAGASLREETEEKKNRISQMATAAVEKAVGLSENVAAAGQRAGDIVRNSAGEATQTARQTARQAAQTAQQAALSAKQAASDLSERAGRTVVETIEQNALLFAGLGLVIGGVIASALPRTDVEDELMGGTSRSARRRAQTSASRAVREGARRAARQAKAESLDPEGLGEAVRDVGERVRHVAEAAVTTAFEPPEESEQSGVHNNQTSRE